MKSRSKKIVSFSVTALILVIFIVLDIFAGIYFEPINSFVVGTGIDFSGEEVRQTLAQSDELVRTLAEDSMVLLKNQVTNGESALPLKENETKVNLFGVSAYDPADAASFDGFLMKGVGSGSSTIAQSRAITLQDALTLNGFEFNTELEALYDGFEFNRTSSSSRVYTLAEPDIASVRELIPAAKAYSDVAIVVFSRLGGENVGEQPKVQSDNENKTYLDISDAEQALLDEVTANFGKVIVLLNTSNIMHCGFLRDEGVDAAMYVGLTGQSGAVAIGEILKGKKLDGTSFSPSGKVSDTYIYTREFDPAFANTEMTDTGADNTYINIQYMENIYIGYRWYETADAEGYFNGVRNAYGAGYDGVVQYPFGYGLSYTDFSWHVQEVSLPDGSNISDADKKQEITVKVLVTNDGDVPGKDVVQLYYTPEYIKGEIEKSAVNLLDFAKTSLLQPGDSEEVTLSFTPYDMASFDADDANRNGARAYELDAGTYTVSLRTDSHRVASCDGATVSYRLSEDIIFDTDPVTGAAVAPKFTGANAYGGVPIDGSTVGASTEYLSRADIAGTFPTEKAQAPTNREEMLKGATYVYDGYDTDVMPTQGVDNGENTLMLTVEGENGLEYNYALLATLAEDYNAPEWETLLNQITVDELINLVQRAGFTTQAIESVGKPRVFDFDGPAGFNNNTQTGGWGGGDAAAETWTAFPCECLLGCSWNKVLLLQMGLSMGLEANVTQLSGWYAPGINLHRTNYTSRNYEYYSEDPVLSGYLAANVIKGAKYNGLYCYMKHFVVSESGPNGRDWSTWLTEQSLRELYLKPFEIAVKKGGANAVMSSFNSLGSIWTGANKALLTDVLRSEWGFKGSVVTDYAMGGAIGGILSGNGGSNMCPQQGVRAGNDIWLAPMGFPSWAGHTDALRADNATDVLCARNAAHNVLYTFVDTLNFNHTADRSAIDDALTVNRGVAQATTPFAWWLMLLIIIEVLAIGGCGIWIFFSMRNKKSK